MYAYAASSYEIMKTFKEIGYEDFDKAAITDN
jgi:hypothetical protein